MTPSQYTVHSLQYPLEPVEAKLGAYLSIDLDYWNFIGCQGALQFLQDVFALDVPIYICGSHENLVLDPEIDKVRKLLNVDFHSDYQVLSPRNATLSCGNWVNYLPWRREGEYVWHYPERSSLILGDCHCDNGSGPFERRPQTKVTFGGYQKASFTEGLPSLQNIAAVGISFDSLWFQDTADYQNLTDFLLTNLHRCSMDPYRWFVRCLHTYQQESLMRRRRDEHAQGS